MAFTLPPSGEAGDDRYQPLAEINVTPMVDVMLVLLIIFMVTAPCVIVGVALDLRSQLSVEDPARIVYVRVDRTISYAQLMDALGRVKTASLSTVPLCTDDN